MPSARRPAWPSASSRTTMPTLRVSRYVRAADRLAVGREVELDAATRVGRLGVEVDEPDGLLRRAATGPGYAGDADRNVRAEPQPGPAGHGRRRLRRNGPVLLQHGGRNG